MQIMGYAYHQNFSGRCPHFEIQSIFGIPLLSGEVMKLAAAFYSPDIAVTCTTNDTAGIAASQRAVDPAIWLARQKQRWRGGVRPVIQVARQNHFPGGLPHWIVFGAWFWGPRKQLPRLATGIVQIAAVGSRICSWPRIKQ
jgi:hypothetical protein